MKKVLYLLISLFVVQLSASETESNTVNVDSIVNSDVVIADAENMYGTPLGFGLVAGFTAGPGFAVKKHFDNRFGFATSFFLVGSKSTQYSGDVDKWVWGNFGIQAMYTLTMNERKSFRFYALAAGNLYIDGSNSRYYRSNSYDYWGSRTTYYDDITYDITKVFGAGLGFEVGRKRITFNAEIPLSVWIWENGDINVNPVANLGLTVYPRRKF